MTTFYPHLHPTPKNCPLPPKKNPLPQVVTGYMPGPNRAMDSTGSEFDAGVMSRKGDA